MKEFWARWATIVLLLTLTTILGRQTLSATVSPGQLSVNPSSINFGNVPVGQNQSQTTTLTNSGGTDATITQATVSGIGFSVRGPSLPLTLSPGQSTTVSVNFTPGSSGSQSGTVSLACSISVNPGNRKGQTNSSVAASVTMTVSGSGVIQGQLAATPSPISVGNVVLGTSQTQSAMLTNSGASNVTISQATVTGAGFGLSGLSTPLTLAPGQSKNFSVVFSAQSTGTATGNVAITSDATDPSLSVALLAAGVASGSLTSNPSSLSFGSVQVGSSTSLTETLTNSGGSSVTITQASASGSGFSISGLTLPLTLIPGQSFTFGAVFAPISAGSASGSISVVSNASNSTLAISLAGTGTAAGQLTVSPSSLNFGSVVVGQSASLTASLSATGSSVTVSSATVTTPEFAVSGLSLPFTLAAGQSASLTVTFKPRASGTATASASFLSNASNSPAIESLTGNGAPPPTHSVSLSWSDSSSGIVGYNVYRGSTSGGPYTKINSFLDASTSYTDSSVQAGQTYYYVTTAVDGSGIESGYSNQVQTVIPTP